MGERFLECFGIKDNFQPLFFLPFWEAEGEKGRREKIPLLIVRKSELIPGERERERDREREKEKGGKGGFGQISPLPYPTKDWSTHTLFSREKQKKYSQSNKNFFGGGGGGG